VNDQPPVPPQPPAGWYQDGSRFRYWDGQAWTDHRAPEHEPERAAPVTAKPLADTVTAIAGAVTAAAALVVVPGGVAMLLRLYYADLPADFGVVASLPSQFLLAVGGAYILFPLLVASGLAIVVVVVVGKQRHPNAALLPGNPGEPGRPRITSELRRSVSGVEGLAIWAFMILAVAVMLAAVKVPELPWGLLVIAAALLTVLIWRWGAGAIARRHPVAAASPAAVALLATLTTAVFLPWAIAFSVVRGELPPATVCRADGDRVDGYLIGETSNRVYVGELRERVAVILPGHQGLQRDVIGALHDAVYEVRAARSPREISSARYGVVIADLTKLGPSETKRLVKAQVRVLAFAGGDAPDWLPGRIELVGQALIADRDQLGDRVGDVFEEVDPSTRPERRITSVPSNQVSRLLIGTLGRCPPVGES
jgi:hypothetical protein